MEKSESRKRIFVCGVHGVGKTQFIKKFKDFTSYSIYSCSKLIKDFSGLQFKDKRISDIDGNHVSVTLKRAHF